MPRDYVPGPDALFDNWFNNINAYLDGKTGGQSPQWPDIPSAAVNRMREAYDDWHGHYVATLTPHTPAQTRAKNDARARAEAVLRLFVRQYLHFDPVSNSDRTAMGIPNRDAVRTDHWDVPEHVDLSVGPGQIREVIARVRVRGAAGNAKPPGYDGAVLVWALLDSPPADVRLLTSHSMASRHIHTLRFEEAERGRTAYVCAAWQNERGILGPWSDIQGTIVP